MPTAITGFTRDEVINQIIDIVGNSSSAFSVMLQNNITSWQYEFLGLHDWSFLRKNGVADSISFSTSNAVSKYTLNTATIIAEMDNTNVECIYSQTAGKERKLSKVELGEIRVGDPGQTADGDPYFWAPYGRQGIVLYPTPTGTETLYVDGKTHGTELHTNVPLSIPYKYQDLFIQWCLFKALRRERDPRAREELQTFTGILKANISEDTREITSNLRVLTANEAIGTDADGDLNSRLWNYGD